MTMEIVREMNHQLMKIAVTEFCLADLELYQHSKRVQCYALKLATAVDMPLKQKRQLKYACLFHDLGKLLVDRSILEKPGLLSIDEYKEVKKHPQLSCEILPRNSFFDGCSSIIIQHHERIDGNGYPHGLKDKDILLEAKILGIADSFDAMTSKRIYRNRPLTYEETINELIMGKGTQFDANLVDIIAHMINQSKLEKLGNGQIEGV